MSHLLGIDIGTSGTKTLICDDAGEVLATAMAAHEVSSPHPGWSEQDPERWWAAVGEATRAVVAKAEIKPEQVTSIGLSGQMHGSVFLADDEIPLRPALLWNDQRTAAECDWIETQAGGRQKLIERVGNPALTGFTAPKIVWVRDHEPHIYEKTRHVLLPKDYIRLRLTGEYATDVGDASGTLLLDVKRRAWNVELMSLLGIDAAWMPRCVESHEVTGALTAKAADVLGLPAGTPVVGGSGDQPAGAVGNGIVTGGVVSATLGTSGVVFAHADQPVYDLPGEDEGQSKDGRGLSGGGVSSGGRVHTMCAAVEGKWCVFGCMLAAGGSFEWLANTLGQAQAARARRDGNPDDRYDLLIEEASTIAPGCEGLFFLPYLTGERCPHPDPKARGGWIGLTTRHGRAAMIRSLLEGVTFGMADALQIIAEDMGIPVETVRLAGGGARSGFWRQLQADVYRRPVATINSDEGPAYGAAILAGVGAGVWASVPEACRASIHQTEPLRPNPALTDRYAAYHRQYQRLYTALTPEFDRIAALP